MKLLIIFCVMIGVCSAIQYSRGCYKGDVKPNSEVMIVSVNVPRSSSQLALNAIVKGDVCITVTSNSREYIFKNINNFSDPPIFAKGVENARLSEINATNPQDRVTYGGKVWVKQTSYPFIGLTAITVTIKDPVKISP
ncbi:hypothetical protein PPL_09683 [Heterostelium album PN500]|uniref:Uncharacterized protein n=1 Tax=Heterostelium pallidum (strain ATCC 26659 / Pp 5 / PN500) TaxID=670386 RepID=D3BNI0_HETP5|nr:hypothetical protein PPL_09683 [Heterostelium album PN500]EFA76931.1 hypothetical protein PPL_09683 [Heterostelium album PN500]|eukprot:XP_020429063.1 hypothetical protein PPL_09683 [Heterostelium album PN500]